MTRVALSDRQVQVYRLLREGLTQAQVAEQLQISPRTVWHHAAILRQKTGAATTASAISRVRARGLAPRSGTPVESI